MTQVLISRPQQAARDLAEKLDGLGVEPIVMPLYGFSSLQPANDLSSAWSASQGRKLAVFTSPRAVRFGLPWITEQQLAMLEFAVVGSATAAALKAAGYLKQMKAETGFTSEDLLQVPELATQAGQAVIFCAPGGRTTLATGLADLGWQVRNAMVYERIALQPNEEQLLALSNADKLLSVWTSISALTLAQQNLPAELWQKILRAPSLVISKRIQHHLESLGAASVALSEGPGNFDLFKAVERASGK